jgi:hypothetical protein
MYVFCVGMLRSGSTWQYEVVSDLRERFRGGRRGGVLTAEWLAAFDPTAAAAAWESRKFHEGHPCLAEALAAGQALAVYSYRDLRDVTYSLVHKFSASFEDVVERKRLLHTCLENDRFWRSQPGVLCQRYEDTMADPAAGVRALAAHLGLRLPTQEVADLVARYSLAANKQRTAEMARQLQESGLDLADASNTCHYDEHSLLHWNISARAWWAAGARRRPRSRPFAWRSCAGPG